MLWLPTPKLDFSPKQTGRNANGWREWKHDSGKTLDELKR